jgi:hypothetical protein
MRFAVSIEDETGGASGTNDLLDLGERVDPDEEAALRAWKTGVRTPGFRSIVGHAASVFAESPIRRLPVHRRTP